MISISVEDILKKHEIDYSDKGKDFLLHCLSVDHDDTHASLRVDRETGKFHCLSCGFKGNIFAHFEEYRSPVYDAVFNIRESIDEIQRISRGLDMPEGAIPFEEDFRDISAETYKKFDAFTYAHSEYENRIIFPIKDAAGKILCFNGRHQYSDQIPKYKIYPVRATFPVYPFISGVDTLILVEGLFDMLNLHDKGITNVACLFGTNSISYNNVYDKLLPFMVGGTRKFLVLLDNDKAGRYAAKKLVDLIKLKTKCECIDISTYLDEGDDPGGLTQKEVNKLSRQLESLVA